MKRSFLLPVATLLLCSNSIECNSYFTPSYTQLKDIFKQTQESMRNYKAALAEQKQSANQYLEKLTKKEALVVSYYMQSFSDNFYN